MGQLVIKCLQGDYLWQAPAATAGDGVCVRQNSGISWGYMSTFRALVGRILSRMDAKELQMCLNGWCAQCNLSQRFKKINKYYAYHNKLMGSVYHFCHDMKRRLNIWMVQNSQILLGIFFRIHFNFQDKRETISWHFKVNPMGLKWLQQLLCCKKQKQIRENSIFHHLNRLFGYLMSYAVCFIASVS